MSLKSFACVAALSAIIAAPALAAPSLSFVDNENGTVTLMITPSGTGSIATEIQVTADFDLTSAVIADAATFDTDNPGNNTLTSTETTGLALDLGNDQLFASHGSIVLGSASAVSYLTIGYDGTGTISASGLVAEGAATFTPLSDSILIDPVTGLTGDHNSSGLVEQGDLDLVLLNWGANTPPVPSGWTNVDDLSGQVDQAELDAVLLNWGNSSSSSAAAVPEPTAAVLALLAGIAGLGVRRNS